MTLQAALGDPLQYIGNLPFNFEPPMVGQPPTLDPAITTPIPGELIYRQSGADVCTHTTC